MHKTLHVLASLCLLSVAGAAQPLEIQTSEAASAMRPAQKTVKPPDTPAGRALTEFVESFNAGGKTRQTWLETRTTIGEGPRGNILKIDAQLLQDFGPLSVVRIVDASQEALQAVVRHGKSDMHSYLTITVEPAAPHKVANLNMRAAQPDEIKGSGQE